MKESDDTDDTAQPTSPRALQEVNVAAISVVHLGDTGSVPLLGSPTGHTSVLQLPDKSVGRALAERTVGSGVGEARSLAKHKPTGMGPRPGFEHRGE